MSQMFEELEDFAETVVADFGKGIDELFPPRPGGKVDSNRQDRLRAEAYQEYVSAQEKDTEIVKPKLRFETTFADVGAAYTVNLSSVNSNQLLLPRDYDRREAVLLAVDNPVYITTTEGLSVDVAGQSSLVTNAYWLPVGIRVTISNTAPHWVAATTTASNSRVSVLISKDSA
jgi:hypothetical protein